MEMHSLYNSDEYDKAIGDLWAVEKSGESDIIKKRQLHIIRRQTYDIQHNKKL